MSIQAIFNKQAIDMLPALKVLIDKADDFESNQMKCYALQAMMNSRKPISEMTEVEVNDFEDDLFNVFRAKNWLA